ncbi:hypothetical protein WJX72_012514 [[Myrmecia] bisecta]|uniref:Glycosyltransferase 2-like domain-containing protein n=1 Tax=[Myrmecia] bisecta TaxID=41462 RepID=A0AAW1QGU5_9CHLO
MGVAAVAQELPDAVLGLVMIVRNEAASMEETIVSVRDDVDFWTIVDTGSTDNTSAVITAAFQGVPGQLVSEPFVDFSVTRNSAMHAHGTATAYQVMLDADHTMTNTWRLRLACKRLLLECQHRTLPICVQAGMTPRLYRSQSHMWTRVFPSEGAGTSHGWHYRYPVHEVPYHTHNGLHPDHFTYKISEQVLMEHAASSHNKSQERWRNFDLPLLAKAKEEAPTDARIAFYYAQTLHGVGEREAALQAYQDRVDLAGWHEEVFESKLRQANILGELGRDPTQKYLDAWAMSPHRAEPLYALARYHERALEACPATDLVCRNSHRVQTFLYAKQAAALPRPQRDVLFVEDYIYEQRAMELLSVQAWWLAKELGEIYSVGRAAAEQLVQKFPDNQLYMQNIKWYNKLAEERQLSIAAAPGTVST